MMASLFSLFMIEMWMNNKMGGHSHGGARGFEETPDVGTTVVAATAAPAAPAVSPPRPQRSSTQSSFETDISSPVGEEAGQSESKGEVVVSETAVADVEGQVDPLVYRKMNSK